MIVAEGLGKSYGRVPAVDDLSFEVRTGAVTGFLGPNGAGKSTTLRLMLQLVRGRGVTTFGGRRYRELRRPLREVGAVLDARSVHPARTARHHLGVLAASAGVPVTRVDEVLATVGLLDEAESAPRTFSLGMHQRLALAAALLGDPPYLLLDEPANGLDPEGIGWLRRMLQHLAAEDRAVLVSSHLLAETALMADDLVVIGNGRLISSGPVEDFIGRFTQRVVVVRSPHAARFGQLLRGAGLEVVLEPDGALVVADAEPSAIGEFAAAHEVTLHELSVREASLEEAFLEATGSAVRFRGRGRHADDPAPAER